MTSTKSPAPFFRGGAYASPAKSDPTLQAMLLVTLLHAVALVWLLYHPTHAAPQPVLSFTVTLMDMSSSQSTISSAASAASTPAAKPEPKKNVEDMKPDPRAATLKKVVAPVAAPSPKNAPLSHHSQEQTAVLAPITPAQFDAAYLQNPAPAYPSLSRRLGEQGNVLLAVYVSEDGRAETVQIKKGSGFNRLDNAALESVKRWRFAAAKQGERLVASWVHVPVKFILE